LFPSLAPMNGRLGVNPFTSLLVLSSSDEIYGRL
jgi:hypothetical protein